MHWIRPDLSLAEGGKQEMMVRIRYRQALQKATLYMQSDYLYIVFDKAQRGITSGQFAAWHDGDEVIGSGVIV